MTCHAWGEGVSYFAAGGLASVGLWLHARKRTLSHTSMPRLVFFPPFCISLSLPTDTALKANICTCGQRRRGRRRGHWRTPSMIPYGRRASKGTPMAAKVSEGGGRWAVGGDAGVQVWMVELECSVQCELPGLTNVGTWVCEGLGTASSQEASSSRRQILHVHTLARPGRRIARVARRCTAPRIAKTRALRPQAPPAGAYCPPATPASCTATSSAPTALPHPSAPWQSPQKTHCISQAHPPPPAAPPSPRRRAPTPPARRDALDAATAGLYALLVEGTAPHPRRTWPIW